MGQIVQGSQTVQMIRDHRRMGPGYQHNQLKRGDFVGYIRSRHHNIISVREVTTPGDIRSRHLQKVEVDLNASNFKTEYSTRVQEAPKYAKC